jgi:signal transduction histidine kinase
LFASDQSLSGDQVDEGQRALAALVEISRAIAEAGLDLPRISDALTSSFADLVGDACAVHLLSDDGEWLRTTSVDHRDAEARDLLHELTPIKYPAYSGPSAEVLRSKAAVFVPVTDPLAIASKAPPDYRAYATRFPVHSLLIVPVSAANRVIGTLSASRTDPNRPYTISDKRLLQELGDRLGLAITAARKHDTILSERDRLRAQTAELEAVMSAAPVAVWVALDPECHCILGNPESYRLLKMAPGTNISMTSPDSSSPRPYRIMRNGTDVPPNELAMQQAAATGEALRDVEFDLVFDNGDTRRMFGSAFPLFDDDGLPRGSVGAFLDVSPLRNAIRVRDDFLTIASHELKTPLTSVELNITSLLRSFKTGRIARIPPEEIERRLMATWRDSKRLATLINDLLDVSRIAAGRLVLERSDLDLRALITEIVSRFEDQAADANCALTIEAPSPVAGLWDRNRLDQILTNLISNAIKYGRGKPIAVVVERTDDTTAISVSDHGIGIALEDQLLVFRRFERAVAAGHLEGAGLGLWIVKQLVEAHGGTIAVTSALGQGATFKVELPNN